MLVGVRFVVRRCFSAPQRPICFSPSSHSQLLLESAAAAFPRPAARSTPFDPAAVYCNLLFLSSACLSVVVLLVHRTRGSGRGAAGRHYHRVLRHHAGRLPAPVLRHCHAQQAVRSGLLCGEIACLFPRMTRCVVAAVHKDKRRRGRGRAESSSMRSTHEKGDDKEDKKKVETVPINTT